MSRAILYVPSGKVHLTAGVVRIRYKGATEHRDPITLCGRRLFDWNVLPAAWNSTSEADRCGQCARRTGGPR